MGNQTTLNNRRLYSMLKGYMTQEIFDAAAAQPLSFGRGEKLMLDGSGAVYMTAKRLGMDMPSLRTPSDLDIAVYMPKPGFSDNEGPLIRTVDAITNKLGYEHDKGSAREMVFQYGVKRHFSFSEIEQIAASRPDISSEAPREGMDVWLPLQLIPGSRPLLKPRFLNEGDNISLRQPIEMVGAKLALCFDKESDKPTHLIDLYNLIHAKPAIMNIDPASPNNDLDQLRTLTVLGLAQAGAPSEGLDISHLLPTEENVDRMYEAFRARYEHHGTTIKKAYIKQQLEEVSQLVHTVLGGQGEQIELSANETDFLKALNHPTHASVDANIRTDLLKADHPQVFEAHPELEKNIVENDFMRDRVHQNCTRVGGAQIW
ncbi:MAG: hypothetical protein MRY32_00090 [Rickettsiales bacterium]|nr:hypothetical protein [Rickettsiales bacterium]